MLKRVNHSKIQVKPSKSRRRFTSSTAPYSSFSATFGKPIATLFSLLNYLGRPGLIGLIFLAQLLLKLFKRVKSLHKTRQKQSPLFIRVWTLLVKFWSYPLITFTLPHFHFPSPKISWRQGALFGFLGMIVFAGGWFYLNVIKDLPNPETLITRPQKLTTQIFDRNGVLLYKIYKDQNRTLVPLDSIPQITQQAFIAAEDQDFYSHHGISLPGTARAVVRNLRDSQMQGGSTITQQLVKNALLSPQRSLVRKLKEMVLALETEMVYSKKDILQMYLNEVGFGGPVYGVQEAAQQYFGKNISELTLAESALLAGLPKAPTKFSPFGPNLNLAKQRQNYVLDRMVSEKYITNEEAQAARAQPLNYRSPTIAIKAPHFVQFVREFLVDELGEDMVSEGGLQVYTTLDYDLQLKAEAEINRELDRIKAANVSNGAALITAPQTGQILAMVGSRNYFDFANDGQVNLTTALRQPGSAVKPINYSSAFEQGMTPSTIIPDQPVTFQIGRDRYSPTNYDNRYHGPVSARTALANSYNVPAVVVLARYGINAMATLGQKLGITSWNDPARWGLSLTLGGIEVSMLDLASAYGAFANLGQQQPLTAVTAVYNSSGKAIAISPCIKSGKKACQKEMVLKPSTAYLINHILADAAARAPAFGSNSILNIPKHQVAVKTGTSNDFRDNWTIGYTSNFLVATWVGNNDNRPMSKVASGITGASPIWRHLMEDLLARSQAHVFPVPNEIVSIPICQTTGTLSCDNCPKTKIEVFAMGTQPTSHCNNQTAQAPSLTPAKTYTLSTRIDRD